MNPSLPYNALEERRGSLAARVPMTTFGKPRETGPAGYGMRLAGSPQYSIFLPINMNATGVLTLGTLTAGLWATQCVIHNDTTVAGAVTLSLAETAPGEGDGVDLIAIADTGGATLGVNDLDTPILMPLSVDRTLEATIGTAAAGEFSFVSLLVTPVAFDPV
jgi:hypothetical protein